MAEETAVIDNADGTQTEEGGQEDANKQLRAHAKKVEQENRALREQVMRSHLAEIGLDFEKGLGKAIAKDYDGDFTMESVKEFALNEYSYEVAGDTGADAQPDVAAAQRAEALQNQGQSVTPQGQPTEAEKAAAKMHDPEATRQDAQVSIAGKVNQFAEQHYGASGPQSEPK